MAKHAVLLQEPFSQMPEEHTVPQEPQFEGSTRRFAVQLGAADEDVLEEVALIVVVTVTFDVMVTVDGYYG